VAAHPGQFDGGQVSTPSLVVVALRVVDRVMPPGRQPDGIADHGPIGGQVVESVEDSRQVSGRVIPPVWFSPSGQYGSARRLGLVGRADQGPPAAEQARL